MKLAELCKSIENSASYQQLAEFLTSGAIVGIEGSRGSHASLLAGVAAQRTGKIQILVADNRDEAAYTYNDLYNLLGDKSVYFFPTAYKKSIEYGQEEPSGIVQRTAVLSRIAHFDSREPLTVCTYPEALAELVASDEEMRSDVLKLSVGQRIPISELTEKLFALGFSKVDFVYEPGQFSVRGGIFDLFSYVDNRPYRIDFFDADIESIRIFDINSQRSVEDTSQIEVYPHPDFADKNGGQRITLLEYAGERANVWVHDADYLLRRIGEVKLKLMNQLGDRGEDPRGAELRVASKSAVKELLMQGGTVLLTQSLKELRVENMVEFHTESQPSFNKNFELLAETFRTSAARGFRNYIVTDNKAQVERLENIFSSIGQSRLEFANIDDDLHAGYIDNQLKVNVFTDHQIFDRHHKYTLHKEIRHSEAMTISELNALKIGDYVVHIDHGVGRFGGLVKTTENGQVTEAVKLVYRDNDVLLVNVHALHRISKYKDKDAEAPRIYKLGSGAWQRLKQTTKAKVKDIARELIALYAKRKASEGFRFAPDNYMQQELEASFMYEDTPDQQKATQDVKGDMESSAPMDRLVCGDVGFGKTEVAMRAAFKAACDGKQVAVLVPTTILCLQHYRSFSKRFREFPVRVEHLSRAKSSKQVKEVLADLKEGKIDILIGTHKILGKNVLFKDLGLLIIDEEQKFGVSSKEKLRQIKANIDTLTLTATPIPRTLQFSLMGSRDLSIINTPPPNRQPVETQVHLFDETIIKDAIDQELSRGGQIYFLHNRVETLPRIREMILRLCPDAKVAVGHGQMNSEELEKLMMDFIFGEYDVLVATTIIESGIDIPNANTIIINNGQMFGLSDLHQLRGRVGRSNRKAYCYILTPPEENLSDDARRRLRAIEEFSDLGAGFNLAMQDLDIRGAGNILGGEQSGFIADIGFETYQKILNEAVMELREENPEAVPESADMTTSTEQIRYISDCQIDTDRQALIPDEYIGSQKEKILLYRQLDSMETEAAMQLFVAMLHDRFGEIPTPTRELLDIVRMRWIAIELGFERIRMKNGIMILYFVEDQRSNYYKSRIFTAILQRINQRGDKFIFKQYNNKLQISVKNIKNSTEGLETLQFLRAAVDLPANPADPVNPRK